MENEGIDIEARIENQEDGIDTFSIFRKAYHPVILKFNNLVYKIKPKKSKGWRNQTYSTTEEKTILKDVSGIVKPGEMLAVLGPSGSGKTTLLTALGGRLNHENLTGTITYNNKPFSKGMKRKTGFVTQDDVLHPHLTVIETLVFTALLRLPNSLTKHEKIRQVEMVVTQLGLSKCKNCIIGGPFLRGISGGERKRVSIGQEILINPSLLLLDEPTSGLDSTIAQWIVSILWKLAHEGRTIITIIHQPYSRLFYMFDKILLLSEGNPLYFGVGSNAMNYFASVGYSPSMAMNPADFLLDIANGMLLEEFHNQKPEHTGKTNSEAAKEALIGAYKINLANKLNKELQEHDFDSYRSMGTSLENMNFGEWPTTWWQQFYVLLKRDLKERRHESFSGHRVVHVLFLAFLCGLLWWKSDISHLQDQIGLLFFFSQFWGFHALFQEIFTFPQERRMINKERCSGMYRLSSYFMSRVIGDLPMKLILPTVFLIITYWMAGLKQTVSNFIVTLLVLLSYVLTSGGLGLAIGAWVMDPKIAVSLASVTMLSFLLATGYYVRNVPKFISWFEYLSTGHYAYKLFISSQYKKNDMYPCGEDGKLCFVGDYDGIRKVGLDGQVVSVLAFVGMLVAYYLIAYIALMRIGKAK